MKVLDKIYLYREQPKDYFDEDWHELPANDVENIEYIRKDALLEYLRKEFALIDFHLKAQDDPVWWGQCNAFQQVIDKINSL